MGLRSPFPWTLRPPHSGSAGIGFLPRKANRCLAGRPRSCGGAIVGPEGGLPSSSSSPHRAVWGRASGQGWDPLREACLSAGPGSQIWLQSDRWISPRRPSLKFKSAFLEQPWPIFCMPAIPSSWALLFRICQCRLHWLRHLFPWTLPFVGVLPGNAKNWAERKRPGVRVKRALVVSLWTGREAGGGRGWGE